MSAALHDGMVVGPALVGPLVHDQSLEGIGAFGVFAHGIGKRLGAILLPHPGKGEVEQPVTLKGEGPLLEAVGQSCDGLRRLGQRLVVVVHACYGDAAVTGPEEIALAPGGLKHTRVDALHAVQWLDGWREGSYGTGRCGDADAETALCSQSGREEQIVAALMLHAVGCPHGVAFVVGPRHLLLVEDDSVVGPVGEVGGGKDVVVGHGEPPPLRRHRTDDVVGRVEIDTTAEDAGSRIGGVLVTDHRVLARVCLFRKVVMCCSIV